jgi:WD40 repeat protein
MALSLLALPRLYLLAGWESGLASVSVHIGDGKWQTIYASTPHTQPILSLSPTPDFSRFFTSGADAVIAAHSIPAVRASSTLLFSDQEEPKVVQTKHAGQQSLTVRNDGKVLATAGWDGRVRVYSVKTMGELACLKWHREGVYAVSFADVVGQGGAEGSGIRDETGRAESAKERNSGSRGQEVAKRAEGDEMVLSVGERRTQDTRNKHWLAAGSKDGKVSLWEIY